MDTLRELQALMPGRNSTEKWKILADRLNRIADRRWTDTYVLSCSTGSAKITKTMRAAALQLGAILDSTDKAPLVAGAVPAATFTSPGNDIDGAFIQGSARRCPQCGSKFVPSVPWRQWCPACRPARRQD